jgi:hypothetical protein
MKNTCDSCIPVDLKVLGRTKRLGHRWTSAARRFVGQSCKEYVHLKKEVLLSRVGISKS